MNLLLRVVMACPLFLFACSKPIEIKSADAKLSAVETTVSTVSSGTVEALQQAALSFGSNGRVEKIYVRLGDTVKKGQKIASIENKDAMAIMEQTERDYETSRKLLAEGLISKSALAESKKAFEVGRSGFERTVMIAPFAGLVSELNLQIGETPLQNNPKVAVRIVDLAPRIIKGNIDEIDLSKVQVLAKARVRVQSIQTNPFSAIVTKVVPFISTSKEQERTAQVELKLLDEKLILPAGASADIEIVIASKQDALSVPARAIFGISGKRYVYKIDNDRLRKVDVEVGIGNYERMEILKGISLGDSLALTTENAELSEGLKVKVKKIAWP